MLGGGSVAPGRMQSTCHTVSSSSTITTGGTTVAAILPSVSRARVLIGFCLTGSGNTFAATGTVGAEGTPAEITDLATGIFIVGMLRLNE